MKRFATMTLLTALILSFVCVGAVAEIIPPHGMGQIGFQAVVLCEKLSLRQNPSASSRVIQSLNYGDVVLTIEDSDGWTHCTLGDSEDSPNGWVNSDYIIVDPAWYRTERKTPVYAWNDLAAPKVALLDENTAFPILNQDGDWLLISLRGAAGWIHR